MTKRGQQATFVGILVFTAILVVFPFVNPCTTESATACTWDAAAQGNGTGWTFTDYYGIKFYISYTN